MQYKIKEYDENLHDKFKCLSVKQPYATMIRNGSKTIELRNFKTSYRGNILICSTKQPIIKYILNGCSMCFVELFDIVKTESLSDYEFELTGAQLCHRDILQKKYKYAWILRNLSIVIEFPIIGNIGLFDICYTKGNIMPYPVNVKYDPKNIKL